MQWHTAAWAAPLLLLLLRGYFCTDEPGCLLWCCRVAVGEDLEDDSVFHFWLHEVSHKGKSSICSLISFVCKWKHSVTADSTDTVWRRVCTGEHYELHVRRQAVGQRNRWCSTMQLAHALLGP